MHKTVSLVLPCNVVLESVDGGTRVAAADPRDLLITEDLSELANDATARLERATHSLLEPTRAVWGPGTGGICRTPDP